MNRKLFVILFSLICCCAIYAQEKSELQKQAEAVDASQNIAKARSLYIRAFDDYAAKGQTKLELSQPLDGDHYVVLYDDSKKLFIREGSNQNDGKSEGWHALLGHQGAYADVHQDET